MAILLSSVALLAAAVALLYAWRLHTELDRATARLDRYNKALFDAGEELRRLQVRLEQLAGTAGVPSGQVQKAANITLEF